MAEWVNACYVLLDRPVVLGRADEPALLDDGVTHARLLEDVAAVAGILRTHGVGPGVPVRVDVTEGRHAVTALLAAARLGAVLDEESDVVVGDDSVGELSWSEAHRVGLTDPAPVADLPADAPWEAGRTAGDLTRDVGALRLPVSSDQLLSVLRTTLEP